MIFITSKETASIFNANTFNEVPNELNPSVIWYVHFSPNYFGSGRDLIILIHRESGYVVAKILDEDDRELHFSDLELLALYTETSDIMPVSNKLNAYSRLLERSYTFNVPSLDREIQRAVWSVEREINKELGNHRVNILTSRLVKKLNKVCEKINTKAVKGKASKQKIFTDSMKKMDRKLKKEYGPILKGLNPDDLVFDYKYTTSPVYTVYEYSLSILRDQTETAHNKQKQLENKISKYLKKHQTTYLEAVKNNNFKSLLNKLNSLFAFAPTEFSSDAGEYTDFSKDSKKEKVYEFTLRLEYPNISAMRVFRVPADTSFEKLEYWINRMLSWTGYPYHLGSFVFPKKISTGSFEDTHDSKEIAFVLERSPEEIPDDIERQPTDYENIFIMDPFYDVKKGKLSEYKLKDLFPKYTCAYYRYDFGENWYLTLELTSVYDIDDPIYEGPQLLDAIGIAPPEDYGGPLVTGQIISGEIFDSDSFEENILPLDEYWPGEYLKRAYALEKIKIPMNLDDLK